MNQLYVAPRARGMGVAKALIDDSEARLKAAGVRRARLYVIEQNAQARAFYEKCGWVCAGLEVYEVPAGAGRAKLPAMRYEKELAPA